MEDDKAILWGPAELFIGHSSNNGVVLEDPKPIRATSITWEEKPCDAMNFAMYRQGGKPWETALTISGHILNNVVSMARPLCRPARCKKRHYKFRLERKWFNRYQKKYLLGFDVHFESALYPSPLTPCRITDVKLTKQGINVIAQSI